MKTEERARLIAAMLTGGNESAKTQAVAAIERGCKAEERLATVPALVQILHRYYEAMALERGAGRPLDPDTYTLLLSDAREALAAWEAAQ